MLIQVKKEIVHSDISLKSYLDNIIGVLVPERYVQIILP